MEEKRIQGNSDWLKASGLDLEDRVDCEVKGCEDEADWYMLHRCCGRAFLGCGTHCHSAIRHLIFMSHQKRMAKCGWCGEVIMPMSYMTRPQPLQLT